MAWLKHLLSNLGGSFWFIPALIVLGSIVLAGGAVEIDALAGYEWTEDWPRLFGVDAAGARAMLTMIGGSIVTVVGVTFSMTLMTLSLAANQYTPRILRNFMHDRVTQVVLGFFAGIFTYCLIVLRTIRDNENAGGEFIPRIAVAVSMVLAIGGVGMLILFIHHVASSIQASNIIATVARDTSSAVDRLFPDKLGHGIADEGSGPERALAPDTEWLAVPALNDGYIQYVDNARLLRLACEHNTVVRMEHRIGTFVSKDSTLLSIARPGANDADLAADIRTCFDIHRFRTLEQDTAYGIRQLVDMVLKALSPSTNDSTTAVMCIDYLAAILARLATRKFPSNYRYDDDNTLRVITDEPTFGELLELAFSQARASAEGNAALLLKLVEALHKVAACARSRERLLSVKAMLENVAEAGWRTLPAPTDRSRLEAALALARARMDTAAA